jgi:hypothetical protein
LEELKKIYWISIEDALQKLLFKKREVFNAAINFFLNYNATHEKDLKISKKNTKNKMVVKI